MMQLYYSILITAVWFGTMACAQIIFQTNCKSYKIEPHARVITGKTYDIRSIDVLTELNWKSLKLHFKSKKASFMHKVHNNAVP